MKARVIAYWDELSERDRKVLVVGGVVCFFYLFYALLYAPLAHAVDDSRAQIIEKQATLAWMKQVRPQAHHGKAAEVLDAAQLLTVLSNQLATTSFRHFKYQLQQAGPKEIQLTFDNVPYNASITWLSTVSQRYAFSIKQLNVERTDKSGVVKLMLVIEVV